MSRKFACAEGVRLTDERDAPAAKRSGRVSEANCVAAARPRVRSFREAKVARVRARFRGVSGEKIKIFFRGRARVFCGGARYLLGKTRGGARRGERGW